MGANIGGPARPRAAREAALVAALERIALRRPSYTNMGSAFYRCRQDAREALKEYREDGAPSAGSEP